MRQYRDRDGLGLYLRVIYLGTAESGLDRAQSMQICSWEKLGNETPATNLLQG